MKRDSRSPFKSSLLFICLTFGHAHAMIIFVDLPSSEQITLDVEPSDNIENIRSKIQDSSGILTDDQYLYFTSNLLDDPQLSRRGGFFSDGNCFSGDRAAEFQRRWGGIHRRIRSGPVLCVEFSYCARRCLWLQSSDIYREHDWVLQRIPRSLRSGAKQPAKPRHRLLSRSRAKQHASGHLRYGLSRFPPPSLSATLAELIFTLRSACERIEVVLFSLHGRWYPCAPLSRV